MNNYDSAASRPSRSSIGITGGFRARRQRHVHGRDVAGDCLAGAGDRAPEGSHPLAGSPEVRRLASALEDIKFMPSAAEAELKSSRLRHG